MILSQRQKLINYPGRRLSIGITVGGEPRFSIGIPWESTVNAYNMRTPDVYIAPEDLENKEIMDFIQTYDVIGCYIWAPLEDYCFLSRFQNIEDISIRQGDKISNLDFLSELHDCRMLYLQDAKIKNLDAIVQAKKTSDTMFGCFECIALDGCEVEDLSVFERESVSFSEFLIFRPEGSNERNRWNTISARTRRYYEYKV